MPNDKGFKRIEVFFSYSHRDEPLRVELEKNLSLLKRQGVISDWNDRRILAGIEWSGEIEKHLESADLILLLVSSDFISSDYCYDIEMKRAMERHEKGEAVVVPIILRPCDWSGAPFANLQALPRDGRAVTSWSNRDDAFTDIAKNIRAISHSIRQNKAAGLENNDDPDELPFRGPTSKNDQDLERRYSNLFRVSSLTIPYVVLNGGWEKGSNEYGMGEVSAIADHYTTYQLPVNFQANEPQYFQFTEPRCRLLNYDCAIVKKGHTRLTFTFSKVEYLDYLRSGEYLDAPLPDGSERTFRDEYAPRLDFNDLTRSPLTNVCGVGVFIITRDNRIILSKHSRGVLVYGETWTYSASGTMDWPDVNPFLEVSRECHEEIGIHLNLDNTYLFNFGIDARKLYFQFSFFENSGLSSDEIISRSRMARDFAAEFDEIHAVPFDLQAIVDFVKEHTFEPAAAACLLTLCSKTFGYTALERAVDPVFVHRQIRKKMEAEWDLRSSRPNELAVMSARYPAFRSQEESQKYVTAVMEFMGDDVNGQAVLELGAGIGRLSELLVLKARSLTCLDLSANMLEQNRVRLGNHAQRVTYLKMYGQDFRPQKQYGIVLSSLVLIHNFDDDDFTRLVDVMKLSAPTIFVFEHADVGSQVSPYTRPRTEQELIEAFSGYRVERRQDYQLFTDNLVFLKLVRA